MPRFVNPPGNANGGLAWRVQRERSNKVKPMCQVTINMGTNSKVFNSPA